MSDLVVGIGLVLVFEGLVWGLAPTMATRLLALAATTPESTLRAGGWLAVAAGFAVVWLVRG
jgi:hypothetical protein